VGRQAEAVAARFIPQAATGPARALVDMAGSSQLQQLDGGFIEMFHLNTFYPAARLHTPTKYCETLEEFFTPMVSQMELSSESRKAMIGQMAAYAQEQARQHGLVTWGYNLPGLGAYINGWMYGNLQGCSPHEAYKRPEVLLRILETAIHEKLGHGFLSVYSALGEVENRLGLTQLELASRFGLRSADDPTASLRREQANLLLQVSQLLEEGWATWVETYMASTLLGVGTHPRGDLQKVLAAINSLVPHQPQWELIKQLLLGAIYVLFCEENQPLEMVYRAVVLLLDNVKGPLDDQLAEKLGQPLRYILGELLFCQAEENLGPKCVPYAALIAANVTLDPAQMGLSDLSTLLKGDARLNPNARMAAISRLKLQQKDDVRDMAKMVSAQLSFSVPKELQ
jgi:hypothetical protein